MKKLTKQERQQILAWLLPDIPRNEALRAQYPDAWNDLGAEMLRDLHDTDLRKLERLSALPDADLIDHALAVHRQREAIAAEKAKGAELTAQENAETARVMDIGRRFLGGRKQGTVGPIRKAIARLLKKTPRMKNTELWRCLFLRTATTCQPLNWTLLQSNTWPRFSRAWNKRAAKDHCATCGLSPCAALNWPAAWLGCWRHSQAGTK